MKNLTRFGKVNVVFAIIFLGLGIVSLVLNLNDGFVANELYQSLSFVSLGIALFFISFLSKKEKDQLRNN